MTVTEINDPTLYALRGAGKRFGSGGAEVRAIQDLEPHDRARRVRGDRRPERLRQDDAAPVARSGLDVPTEGEVLFEGRDLGHLKQSELSGASPG